MYSTAGIKISTYYVSNITLVSLHQLNLSELFTQIRHWIFEQNGIQSQFTFNERHLSEPREEYVDAGLFSAKFFGHLRLILAGRHNLELCSVSHLDWGLLRDQGHQEVHQDMFTVTVGL